MSKKCEKCGTKLLNERIGEFVDFDADPDRHSTEGIPLCSRCLGTGIVIPKFKKWSTIISALRRNNLKIQIEISKQAKKLREEGETNFSQYFIQDKTKLRKNNQTLVNISCHALKLLAKENVEPIEGCLALKL